MIGFVRGIVHAFGKDECLIDVNGIGFRVHYKHPETLKLNEEVTIYTYQNVREDEISLYGFKDLAEYELFIKLISVKGLGPKIASNALASSNTEAIINAIESGDAAFMRHLPGIGAKTASQIILDLKGKLVSVDNNQKVECKEEMQDVIEALKALGYKMKEITPVINQIQNEDLSVDGYVRKALSLLLK